MSNAQVRVVLILIASVIIILRFVSFPHGDNVLEKLAGQSGKYVTITGIVFDDPSVDNISAKFTMQVEKINDVDLTAATNKGSHKISVKTDTPSIRYGDEIEIRTALKKPEIIENDDGRSFDYAAYLRKDKIFYTATAGGTDKYSGQPNVKILSHSKSNPIFSALYDFKRIFVDRINHLLPSPHAFLANGLIVTGKATLSKEMQTDFQRVGLIHIVVLSGYNVTIVGESIARLFSFLPLIASTLLGAVAIVLFSIMTGGGSTVMRAAIMSLIGLYARISGRQNNAITSLMVAGALMLIWNPMLLFYDPSFQMSFAATLGLILYSGPFERLLTPLAKKLRAPKGLMSIISSALSTQLFTLPLIMYLSGIVSLIALPANIAVLPFIPFTMFFIFVAGAASFTVPLLALLPSFVAYMMLSYELKVVGLAASLPFAAIKLPPVSIFVVIAAYAILIIAGAIAYKANKTKSKRRPLEAHVYPINTPASLTIQYEKTPP